ncbi:tail fiber protein [Paenibacillus glycanilyticus]|uniref:phage tail protein n=1 Tax=Paenibacillus glycanilyticus TaxID=126569 RepID=UPI00203F3EE5|nr:tail fiber protein [Paenibacillus glycanilyticus]MCM3628988.1 tail fiber protein [Paenibacillus glycanilyticus]
MYPYIGEIRMFTGNFAPRGWALCNGQILPISQNTALFSLLGTTYGGDGRVTFALPNLQGRAPMHWGQGPGLTPRDLGETSGEASVTLLQTEIPSHNHLANAQTVSNKTDAQNDIWAMSGAPGRGGIQYYSDKTDVTLNPMAVGLTGGSQPHNNTQPFQSLNFIISLEGVFPPRS